MQNVYICITLNNKKMKGMQIDGLFVTAQVRCPHPLPEFCYPTWSKTPKHGIKSITPIGNNDCPSALGMYFYEIEYHQTDNTSAFDLEGELAKIKKSRS